jgi:hypothetical protein
VSAKQNSYQYCISKLLAAARKQGGCDEHIERTYDFSGSASIALSPAECYGAGVARAFSSFGACLRSDCEAWNWDADAKRWAQREEKCEH